MDSPTPSFRISQCVLLILFCAFLWPVLTACGGGGGGGGGSSPPPAAEPARADWTYMIYMGADNNLSTAGLADLNEMEKAGSDRRVNIVLQAEFSTFYTDLQQEGLTGYGGETLRFLVRSDENPGGVNLAAGSSIGNVDMASPDTLTAFIRWAAATYPADRYALVIWDHGAGWKASPLRKGAVEDETSDSFMSLPMLASAVREAGISLDLINFDACLMGMYEVAYEFLGLTDYMVFSEESEPADGDPYDTILAALKARPAMSPADLAETIVASYHTYYTASGDRPGDITKSAVDMVFLPALHTAMVGLADAIVTDYANVSGVIAQAQANGQHFDYRTNLDLRDFVTRLATNLPAGPVKSAAGEVADALTRVVIQNRTSGQGVKDAHGLAVFVPSAGQVSSDALYNDLRDYSRLACNQPRSTVWYDAVETIVDGSYETLHPGGFSFCIKWDTDADVDLYVWEPNGELYAPWMGQTTPNGYFSGDSTLVGESVEYYVANDYVLPGFYDVLVEYYRDGTAGSGANVEFWFLDPDADQWTLVETEYMSLNHPAPEDLSQVNTLEELNAYSNWWHVGALHRAVPQEGTVIINSGGREVTFHLSPKKRRPNFDPEVLR